MKSNYKFMDKIVEVFEVIANNFGGKEFEEQTGVSSDELKQLIDKLRVFDEISDKERYEMASYLPELFLKACIIIDPVEIEIVTSSTWEELMALYKKIYAANWKEIE